MTLSIFAAAREAGDRAAVVVSGRVVTWARLADGARRAAGWLCAQGILTPDPGAPLRPVALVATAELATLELLHAAIALGIPVLPVHPRSTAHERAALESECRVLRWLDATEASGAQSLSIANAPDLPDDERCLALVHSSGSAGRPRGVVLSRRAFAAAAVASEKNLGWRDDDRWLIHLPLAHVGGLSIVTRCLLARLPVVLAATRERFDPAELAQTIAREKVTLVSLVPTQLIRLLELEPAWKPPPFLRAVLIGGAAASSDLVERAVGCGVPILTTYGLTEACSQVATQRPGTRAALGAVGPPLPGVEVRIENGEIQVRGATLLSSYHPDATDPLLAGGWFGTGDLGRLDPDGNLHVLGRAREMIVTGGENVYPREVEAALERIPGVRSACVFGVPDATWGELVVAAVVPAAGTGIDLVAAGARLGAELAPFKRPRSIALVDELPLTASGKSDRAEVMRIAVPLLRPLPR